MKRKQTLFLPTPPQKRQRKSNNIVGNPVPLQNFEKHHRNIKQLKFNNNPKQEVKKIEENIQRYKTFREAADDRFSEIDSIFRELKEQVNLLDQNLLTKEDVSKQLKNKWESDLKTLLLLKKKREGDRYRITCTRISTDFTPYYVDAEPSSSSSLSSSSSPSKSILLSSSSSSAPSSSPSSSSSSSVSISSTSESKKKSINNNSSSLSAFSFDNHRSPIPHFPHSLEENDTVKPQEDRADTTHIAVAAAAQELEEKPTPEDLESNSFVKHDIVDPLESSASVSDSSLSTTDVESSYPKCRLCGESIKSQPVTCEYNIHQFHRNCFQQISPCPLHKCANPECDDPRPPDYLCLACKAAYHGEGGERRCIPAGSSIFDAYIKCGICCFKVYFQHDRTSVVAANNGKEVTLTNFEKHRLISDDTTVFCGHCGSEFRYDDRSQHLGTEFTISSLEKHQKITGLFSMTEEEQIQSQSKQQNQQQQQQQEETDQKSSSSNNNASPILWVMNIPPGFDKASFDKRLPNPAKSKIIRSWRAIYLRFPDPNTAMTVYSNLQGSCEQSRFQSHEKYHLRLFFQKPTHVLFANNLNRDITEPIISNQFRILPNNVFIERSNKGQLFARIVFDDSRDAMDEWIETRDKVVMGHEWILRPYKHNKSTTRSSILRFWNIASSATENDFYELIASKPHKKFQFSHRSSFVEFSNLETAGLAMQEYNGHKFHGKVLVVEYTTKSEMQAPLKRHTTPQVLHNHAATATAVAASAPAPSIMPQRRSNSRRHKPPPEVSLRKNAASQSQRKSTPEERRQKRQHAMNKCNPQECMFCK